MSFEPLPCSAIGPNLLCSGTPVPLGTASGALFALFLVAIGTHVLRDGPGAPKLMRVATVGDGVFPCGGIAAATIGVVPPVWGWREPPVRCSGYSGS